MRIRSIIFALFIPFFITACHKNPLLQEQYISSMKANNFLESDNFPIRECAAYYAGDGNSGIKDKCDKWSGSYYKSLFNSGGIPSTTTLEDFRDPAFWKKIEPKA